MHCTVISESAYSDFAVFPDFFLAQLRHTNRQVLITDVCNPLAGWELLSSYAAVCMQQAEPLMATLQGALRFHAAKRNLITQY